MADEKTETSNAKPRGITLYNQQNEWLKREAERIAKETGRPMSKSKVVQLLIDEKRKAGK